MWCALAAFAKKMLQLRKFEQCTNQKIKNLTEQQTKVPSTCCDDVRSLRRVVCKCIVFCIRCSDVSYFVDLFWDGFF